MKNILLLGATGSIGTQVLDIIRNNLIDYFRTKDITPEMVMEEVMSKYSEDTYYWRDDTVGERLEKMLEENDDKGYIRSFNFSRYRASKTIEDYIK